MLHIDISCQLWYDYRKYGGLAQLGERHVYTVKVEGSIPSPATIEITNARKAQNSSPWGDREQNGER